MLTFGKGNKKIDKRFLTFSLPAGHTCLAARQCRSKADPETGKVTDGLSTKFRCFAASSEAAFPTLRKAVWRNYNLLRNLETKEEMTELIVDSLRGLKFDGIRIHVSGDYFRESYFLAWRAAAKNFAGKSFYCYTKRIDLLKKHGQVDGNHICVASYGGCYDKEIERLGLISARVVFSEEEAALLGLEIDHDDSHAVNCDKNFALLVHGTQPKKERMVANAT